MPAPLSKERVDYLVKLYRSGMSAEKIAAQEGHKPQTILKYLHQRKGKVRRGQWKLTEKQRIGIEHAHRAGYTNRQIAVRLKVSHTTVGRVLRERGVKAFPNTYRGKPLIVALTEQIEHRDGCWHWTGPVHIRWGKVNPEIQYGKKTVRVSRALYTHHRGELDHRPIWRSCDDELCVSPWHYYQVAVDGWERFLQSLEINPDFMCWEVRLGGMQKARVTRDTVEYPHRMAYEEWIGPIPENCEVWRRCGNRHCINPTHLIARHRKATGRGFTHGTVDLLSTDLRCDQGHLMIGSDVVRIENPHGVERHCQVCRREIETVLMARLEEDMEPETPRERFRRLRAEQRENERRIAEALGISA